MRLSRRELCAGLAAAGLKLPGPRFDARGWMHAGHDQRVPAGRDGAVDSAEVRELDRAELNVSESEQSVVQHDGDGAR